MSSARLIAGVFVLGAAMLTTGGADAALTIGGGITQNVICTAHVCRAIRPVAVLNATQLATMLAVSDVTVVSDSRAQDIIARYAFSWTSSHRLTLDSYRSITVDYAMTVAGPGAVTLTTNDGGTGGTFATQFPGRIDFWDLSSSFIVNGANYTLVGDIATLASDITTNPSGRYALAKNYDAGTDGIHVGSPILTVFNGTFEGLGHTVDHLAVHANGTNNHCYPSHGETGLFAETGANSLVENIGLTAVTVRAVWCNYAGALVALNRGTIANAFAKGRV